MHRFIIIALLIAFLSVVPSVSSAESYARSKDELERAYEGVFQSVRDRNRDGRVRWIGALVYCVCAKDRGRIIYKTAVMTSESTVGMDVDWLRKGAERDKSCGGCYMEPTVRIVEP